MSNEGRYGPLKAMYPGICATCDEPLPIGASIVHKGDRRYVHLYCAPGGDER